MLHKLNIALRKSIKISQTLTNLLTSLSNCASEIRMSNAKSKIFQKKKSRIRNENLTRWSSSYLMLNSFYRAYQKKCFSGDLKCPIGKQKIEFYLKLLLPAYRFSMLYQRNKSHIGDVLPGLLLLIEQYKQMSKTRGASFFCEAFIKQLNK